MELSISLVSAFSIIVPAVVGAIVFLKVATNLKVLYGLVVLTLGFEAVLLYLIQTGSNNLFFFHSYVYFEFAVITYIYFSLYDNKLWKSIAISFLSIFLLFSVLNVQFVEGTDVFNSNQRYVEGIMVITMTIAYFAQLMRRADELYLVKSPYFWLNSGFLIYFSGTLFLFLVSKNLILNNEIFFWEIHSVLNIGLNIIYAVALYVGWKKAIE